MERLSKEKAQELQKRIQIAILQSLIRFGETYPIDSVCAINDAAYNLIFNIAEITDSRKEAFEIAIKILNQQKEHFLKHAKEDGIIDIKMRMLNVRELKRIMGFGSDYILIGTQTEQKKFIGNAVECHMSQALCEALAEELNK